MYYLELIKEPEKLKIDTIGPFFKEEDALNAKLLQRWLLEDNEKIYLVQEKDTPTLEHVPENFIVTAHILGSDSEKIQISLESLEDTVQEVLYPAKDFNSTVPLKEGEAVLYSDTVTDTTSFTLCFPWPAKNLLDKDIKDDIQARKDLKGVAENIFRTLYKKFDKSSKIILETNFNPINYKGI